MGYSDAVVRRAQERLASEREQNEHQCRARIESIYQSVPRLRQIDRELRMTAAQVLSATFRSGSDPSEAVARIRKENQALQREREWLLDTENIDPADLELTPICQVCGGTGYNGAQMCECRKELCRQEQKKDLAPLLGAGHDSFEKFRLDYYSAEYSPAIGTSPRKLMERVYREAVSYAQRFTPASASLLLAGATGLGKTFLSACIARTVSDRGFSVSYAPVTKLMAACEEDKFRPQPDRSASAPYYACDLLILDDLGTEMTTQFTVSALYEIINTRLIESRATIISTNLPLDDLTARYSAQIASRLLGSYVLLQFYGDDIRFLQKQKL